jgi:hypothetical protein
MKKFETRTLIHAKPETVWALLTDAASYPSWNTTVDRVDGQIALGKKITVHAKISPGRAFSVRVAELAAPNRMVWTGGMPLGLFKGVRTFTLTPQAGGLQFEMREVFDGLLSPLIEKSLPDLQPAFDEFAQALKRRAESA